MFAKKKSHLGEKEDYQTLFNDAINESVWTIKIPALIAFIAFVALILTFNRTLIFVGLSGIICLVSGAFSAILMGGSFYLTMLTAENDKIKNIMSRNKNKKDGENKKASNLKKAN